MTHRTRITRRRLLRWLVGGTAMAAAAFWAPLRLASQLAGRRHRRAVVIPEKPFERDALYTPHDLAG